MTQIVFTKIMNPSENLRRRSDLSPYLFHFTKDNGGMSAKDIIASIVEETKLKSNTGYICFTEQPLIMCDDYDSDTKTAMPYTYITGASRAWRSINFDRVRKKKMSDYMVDGSTFFEQRIGEDYEHWKGED